MEQCVSSFGAGAQIDEHRLGVELRESLWVWVIAGTSGKTGRWVRLLDGWGLSVSVERANRASWTRRVLFGNTSEYIQRLRGGRREGIALLLSAVDLASRTRAWSFRRLTLAKPTERELF
jgi:hypothetical protein